MRVTCQCGLVLSMAEAHIDERGWLCDPCFFANQPWHNEEPENDNGAVGC